VRSCALIPTRRVDCPELDSGVGEGAEGGEDGACPEIKAALEVAPKPCGFEENPGRKGQGEVALDARQLNPPPKRSLGRVHGKSQRPVGLTAALPVFEVKGKGLLLEHDACRPRRAAEARGKAKTDFGLVGLGPSEEGDENECPDKTSWNPAVLKALLEYPATALAAAGAWGSRRQPQSSHGNV